MESPFHITCLGQTYFVADITGITAEEVARANRICGASRILPIATSTQPAWNTFTLRMLSGSTIKH